MIKRALLLFSILAVATSAQAAWDIGGGLENYQWKEYPDPPSGNPKESGLRSALFVNWTQEKDQGLLLAWRAKLYVGTVNYDTFVMCNCASDGAPVSTKTDYSGAASEGQLVYRYNLGAFKLDQVGGLGLDTWRRRIRNGGGDQIEDYSILYLRAGLKLAKSRYEAGFHGELGIKYPVSTRENAHLDSEGYTSNPAISPKGAVSGYGELGYRINSRFDLVGYYDSWRFGRSADVRANKPADPPGSYWVIYQPKSNMDTLGVKLLVSF
jgi:hypothetical protein